MSDDLAFVKEIRAKLEFARRDLAEQTSRIQDVIRRIGVTSQVGAVREALIRALRQPEPADVHTIDGLRDYIAQLEYALKASKKRLSAMLIAEAIKKQEQEYAEDESD